MTNKKIEIEVGCTSFLIEEVERLRKQNELIGAENNVMHNFFDMFNRMGDKPRQGYGEDRLQQAKKEIAEAVHEAEKKEAGAKGIGNE